MSENRQEKKSITLTFFTKFLLAVIVLQLFVYILQANVYLSEVIQTSITNAVAYVYSQIVNPAIVVDGNVLIHQGSLIFLIVDDTCTGLILLASVCSAIIAFDTRWQDKIKMIVIAILILQCENIIRIVHLLYVVKNQNDVFDMFHLYIWQTINFITAILVLISLDKTFKGIQCS